MRRVRVDERAAVAIGALAGLVAALSPASPTGSPVTDSIVVIAVIGVTTWLSASAPWWTIGLAGGLASVLAFDPLALALGIVATGIGMTIGTMRSDRAALRATGGGLGLNALCRLEVPSFFGATALVGIGLGALVAVLGMRRRGLTVRTIATRGTIAIAAFSVLATIGAGAAMLRARGQLVDGAEFFETAAAALADGDHLDAAANFPRASEAFAAADTAMSRPWAQPARLVPVVAQHRSAATAGSSGGKRASADLAAVAALLDPAALRPQFGRFDVALFENLQQPVFEAHESLVELGADIDEVASGWLIDPVGREVAAAAAEFDDNITSYETLAAALGHAPALLGAGGPRTYFIAFTTPAEARGTGGFMGNYAAVTVDRGKLTVTDFGRTLDLNRGFNERVVEAPADWLQRWGRFGFVTGPKGTTGPEPWSNVTMSPSFPSTGEVISSLFEQSGGTDIDGAFAIDPFVLQAFVDFTGPLTIDPSGERLDGSNTAQFLLFDQYRLDRDDRVDALEEVAQESIEKLLGGALPGPTELSDALGPLVDQGRLVGWMSDPAEQSFFEDIGLAGALPELGDDDGLLVVANNAGANKLDAFLTRRIVYDASFDSGTGAVEATLTITLDNSAPTSGLPDGVIGNYVGDAIGTNRTLLSVYTALPVEAVTVDGNSVPVERGTEAGWNVATLYVTTPAAGSTDIVATVRGALEGADDYSLTVRTQPLVDQPTYDITVLPVRRGDPVVRYEGSIAGDKVITAID